MNRIILNETSYFGSGSFVCRHTVLYICNRRVRFYITIKFVRNLIFIKYFNDFGSHTKLDKIFIVALGGGSSIDTAKGIGIVVNNPDFADVKSLEGVADTKHKAVPTFALPTTAGTAAEVTINYVIIDEDARKKMVCVDPNDIPAVAIVDPELMYSMPKGLTAATGMDALTHAIESYITPGAWVMSTSVQRSEEHTSDLYPLQKRLS